MLTHNLKSQTQTGLDILLQVEINLAFFSMDQQEITVVVLAIWLSYKFGTQTKLKSTLNRRNFQKKGITTFIA